MNVDLLENRNTPPSTTETQLIGQSTPVDTTAVLDASVFPLYAVTVGGGKPGPDLQ
ncbi:MAG: hypothetical protein V4807_03875 [Burkholderia gladioli]|uniref:hypothetical protein n=1 Tax=Burkholderia gladioli TaxID=28095 RepID=UPI001641BE4D|nr:hypothetical protein [Burkholderia gladioli]